MRSLVRFGSFALFVFALTAAVSIAALPEAAAAGRYKCPPCSSACDTTVFTAPGVCPACGMTLVEETADAAAPARPDDRKKVAVLVFNGAEILDSTGPYEMFGAARCDVYTVAASRDPVTTAMGLGVVPKYTFADAPKPDVLVIPGGRVNQASQDQPTLDYIKSVSAGTSNTMSVCNGAFILASAGLLDGLSATTTYGNIPKLAAQYPKVKVVSDRRYVDNGRIITTAGLSAGMDGALHVIAKLFGTGYAQSVALSEEYDWQPEGGYVRAALADHEIPVIDMDELGEWKLVRTEGDTKRWEIAVTGKPKLSAADFMSHMEQAFTKGKWTKVSPAGAAAATGTSTWRFTGSDGKPWKATFKVAGAGAGAGEMTAELSVARAG